MKSKREGGTDTIGGRSTMLRAELSKEEISLSCG